MGTPRFREASPALLRRGKGSRCGFSLIELLVVMAVAIVLTGLMFPAFAEVRENAHRVICSSNVRQVGTGASMYYDDYGWLPVSEMLENDRPEDLMVAHRGGNLDAWDGLGLLHRQSYLAAVDVFYCPSHHGDHRLEDQRHLWTFGTDGDPIYTNYHYSGHREWTGEERPRRLEEGRQLVLATDGLRTTLDLNHGDGMNVLRGDMSVRFEIIGEEVLALVPRGETASSDGSYDSLWLRVEGAVE